MRTHIFNGQNTSKLDWNLMITIHRYETMTLSKWEKEIKSIMKSNNQYNQVYYGCEKISETPGIYHAHILIDVNGVIDCNNLIYYYKKYLVKGREISYKSNYTSTLGNNDPIEIDGKYIKYDIVNERNIRKIEYIKEFYNDRSKKYEKVIKSEYIPFFEINGKDGRCYIETIIGNKNSSYYINKFSERGFTTNYLNRDLL